jgi:hypothetical protein
MTLEFNASDYVILMNGLAARVDKVHRLIEIFDQDDKTPLAAQYYREELLSIEAVEEKLRKAFNTPLSL